VDERPDQRERLERPTLFGAPESAFLADPYPLYARIRTEDPMRRTPHGLWVLTRHADVAAVLRDPKFGREGFERHFGAGGGPNGSSRCRGLTGAPPLDSGGTRQSMLFRDPPHHTRLRGAVSRAFTPHAVEALRPHIQAHVETLLDRVAAAGRVDVIADVAEPLPRAVIGELLGIPEAHRAACAAWSAAVARSLDALPIPEDRPLVAEGQAARRDLGGYVRELIASRRARLGSDLVSTLVEAADADGLLSDSELVAMTVLLLVAGTETTVSLIGTTVWALLQHPAELARVREAPWLLPAAIEEAVRWESPVQRTWRVARTDVALAGQTIPRGALVVLLLGAANRDPARFTDPDRFDLMRRDLGHLAFGAGVHACLGAALARVETQIAVGSLLRSRPSLRLATDQPVWRPTATLRGLAALPVTW
jgi:pimeloyl-[acyl-carrier protein] synthase